MSLVVKTESRYIEGGMRGDWDDLHYVIEVDYDPNKRAWIGYNPPPHERDILAFEIERAQVYTEAGSRNELDRIKCGYPQWKCKRQPLTTEYRAQIAKCVFEQISYQPKE